MKTLSLIPHISEKAYQMSISGTYIFDVPTDANKAEIARLVESKYKVSVITVNVLNRKGKNCLLYTSDAADERSSVDLGGRRIFNKKKTKKNRERAKQRTKM